MMNQQSKQAVVSLLPRKRKQNRRAKQQKTRSNGYQALLLQPEQGLAKIPSLIPIASSVCQTRYSYTVTAPASGLLVVAASPYFLYPSVSYNNVLSETNWGAFSPQGSWSEIAAYSVRRCVAGVMNVTCISNINTIAGAATISLANASFLTNSFDTIRDITDVVSKPCLNHFRQIWLPGDVLDLDYTNGTSIANPNTQIIYFLASGLPVGLTFQIDIRFVMEYVPKTGFTDLLAPTVEAPQASDVVAKSMYSAMKSSLFQSFGDKAQGLIYNSLNIAPHGKTVQFG